MALLLLVVPVLGLLERVLATPRNPEAELIAQPVAPVPVVEPA